MINSPTGMAAPLQTFKRVWEPIAAFLWTKNHQAREAPPPTQCQSLILFTSWLTDLESLFLRRQSNLDSNWVRSLWLGPNHRQETQRQLRLFVDCVQNMVGTISVVGAGQEQAVMARCMQDLQKFRHGLQKNLPEQKRPEYETFNNVLLIISTVAMAIWSEWGQRQTGQLPALLIYLMPSILSAVVTLVKLMTSLHIVVVKARNAEQQAMLLGCQGIENRLEDLLVQQAETDQRRRILEADERQHQEEMRRLHALALQIEAIAGPPSPLATLSTARLPNPSPSLNSRQLPEFRQPLLLPTTGSSYELPPTDELDTASILPAVLSAGRDWASTAQQALVGLNDSYKGYDFANSASAEFDPRSGNGEFTVIDLA